MEALMAATMTAVGSLALAAAQARRVHRESQVLRQDWSVEQPLWLPNLRRDPAHAKSSSVPRPSMITRVRAKALQLAFSSQQKRVELESHAWEETESDWPEVEARGEEFTEYEYEEDETAAENSEHSDSLDEKRPEEKTPVESLRYAPFLLDSSGQIAWAFLLGFFLVAGLIGPQVAPGITEFNAILIPLASIALAVVYPVPSAWGAVAVGLLQGANCLGYRLAGGTFQSSDATFCSLMYLANALAVVLLATNAMRRQRRWIVMRPE